MQVDSQLVVNQVSREYQCADPQMAAYVAKVRRMERHFDGLELRHGAVLAHILMSSIAPRVFKEKLCRPTVTAADHVEGGRPPSNRGNQALPLAETNHLVSACTQEQSWMDNIRNYLKEKILPEGDATAERIARQSKRYAMVDGNLY